MLGLLYRSVCGNMKVAGNFVYLELYSHSTPLTLVYIFFDSIFDESDLVATQIILNVDAQNL